MIDPTKAIQMLLQNKHRKGWLYVPECKNGPTWSAIPHRRLDGWAMKKSWAHPMVDGFEIKVTERDFLQDEKWQAYLPMCNRLWFVCPSGLVQAHDVPADVGLYWASKNFKRLYKKKKAAYRPDAPHINTLLYVLICRTRIYTEGEVEEGSAGYWRNWLKQKESNRRLGQDVSKAVHDKVYRVREENHRLKMLAQDAVRLEQRCAELGFNTDSDFWLSDLINRLNRAENGGLREAQRRTLERAKQVLEQLLDRGVENGG